MPPKDQPKKKIATTHDGFPLAFAEGPARESFPCLCVFCLSAARLAKVRLIEKGQGRGGYAVLCPECSSTMFLCSQRAVDRFRAMQQLLSDDSTRESLRGTLETIGQGLVAGGLSDVG